LQEWVAEVLAQAEEARKQTTQTQLECIGLMSEEVATQTTNTIKEKTAGTDKSKQSCRNSSRRSPRRSRKHREIR
jgi:hypothetical protein